MGRSRGLLERKIGAEPGSLSQKLGSSGEVLVQSTCMPVGGAGSCVRLCSFLGPEATLLVGVCICVHACIYLCRGASG